MNSMLLLSIHPEFADSIIAGAKTVELRRQLPRVSSGPAVIYASSPRMELVATFQIQSTIRLPLKLLWQAVRYQAGVSKSKFDSYFTGLESGVAISIGNVSLLPRPIPLDELRSMWRGFHPPQGFRYLQLSDVRKLGIANREGVAHGQAGGHRRRA